MDNDYLKEADDDNIYAADAYHNLMDEENRKYFRKPCLCGNIFPKYHRCPMDPTTDREYCEYLSNNFCMCDDMDHEAWLEFAGEMSDEELAEMAGVSLDKLKRDTESLERYLGLPTFD